MKLKKKHKCLKNVDGCRLVEVERVVKEFNVECDEEVKI